MFELPGPSDRRPPAATTTHTVIDENVDRSQCLLSSFNRTCDLFLVCHISDARDTRF